MLNKITEYAGDQSALSLEMIAATVAHEIKNPLALIKANIDFIELCDTENKYRKNYDAMKKEINRANELITNFGKYLTGSFDTDEIIELDMLFEEVIEKYSQYDGVTITLSADTEPLMRGNCELLTMAISNVIKNAVEAMDDNGKIDITIRRNKDCLVVNINDNGCGLSTEVLSKLDNDAPVTTKKHGNGIGISVTKKIIALHGGTHTIRNNNYGGASVEWIIPAVVVGE